MIIIISCGLWDLLDVKSEAGLLLAIMSFRPQTYAKRPHGLVDSSKSLNIWLLHGIEPHKNLPFSWTSHNGHPGDRRKWPLSPLVAPSLN